MIWKDHTFLCEKSDLITLLLIVFRISTKDTPVLSSKSERPCNRLPYLTLTLFWDQDAREM